MERPRRVPAYGRHIIPSRCEELNPQIFFYRQGIAVFNSLDDGCLLTNSVVSYTMNQWYPKTLFKCLNYANIGMVYITDARSKVQFWAL
ncbi:hypothetical protein NPIL_602261 [Nephila pilipes]|uniref:Uncharacterized protein n=1 Tax=Nephila pilipes TaxID=299642 RepID=A0A8X6NH02_NEPPI|nr:hypothetical protein NPIL_602261 [Nephila pilipes]